MGFIYVIILCLINAVGVQRKNAQQILERNLLLSETLNSITYTDYILPADENDYDFTFDAGTQTTSTFDQDIFRNTINFVVLNSSAFSNYYLSPLNLDIPPPNCS